MSIALALILTSVPHTMREMRLATMAYLCPTTFDLLCMQTVMELNDNIYDVY